MQAAAYSLTVIHGVTQFTRQMTVDATRFDLYPIQTVPPGRAKSLICNVTTPGREAYTHLGNSTEGNALYKVWASLRDAAQASQRALPKR